MPKQFNRVQQAVSGTPGTGTVTLGAATTGYQTLAAAGAVTGDSVPYVYKDGATAWEVGVGTYNSTGPTLTRTLIQSSTGSLLSLTSSAVMTCMPNAADLMTPDLFGAPGVPAPGLVRLGESSLAGLDWPSWRAVGSPERFLQPLLSRGKFLGISGVNTGSNNTAFNFLGVSSNNYGTVGTVTGAAFDVNRYGGRQLRADMYSTATAGTVGGIFPGSGAMYFNMGGSNSGGFHAGFRFISGWSGGNQIRAASRAFLGFTAASGAPTNVNPSTLTNVIGIAKVDGSNNLNVVFGGSAAQTAIDLGANYPITAPWGDFYEFLLFSDPNDNTRVTYQVNRWNGASNVISNTISGTLTNTTPGTTLPATSTPLSPVAWVSNNTEALIVGLSLSSIYVWSE